jgi:heme exporter protein B
MSSTAVRCWWWLYHKDLMREWRAPRGWSSALVLGVVLALVVTMQIDLPREERAALAGGLFWVAAYFAACGVIERSFAGEREEGCWFGLLVYPAPPAAIYLAKVAVNFTALCFIDCVLIPAFLGFSGAAVTTSWGELLGIVALANLGTAAAGTIVGALTQGLRQGSGLCTLLMLPLISPVLLGAAGATRLLLAGAAGALWGPWGQLLAAFAGLLVVMGALLFEFVIED